MRAEDLRLQEFGELREHFMFLAACILSIDFPQHHERLTQGFAEAFPDARKPKTSCQRPTERQGV
eukprot:9869085-Lingulodinium_polyedra.AAC.1